MPLAGDSCCGSIFKIFRSFVHTSNVQPTPQYVHTVFVFLILSSRIAASVSDIANKGPLLFSTFFVKSIIERNKLGSWSVINPASPIIDVSINALHGQTVTH